MESQNRRLLTYLSNGKSITTLEAFKKLGITRLSGRIYDVQKLGYPIEKEFVHVDNRFGEKCRVVEYRLGTNQIDLF